MRDKLAVATVSVALRCVLFYFQADRRFAEFGLDEYFKLTADIRYLIEQLENREKLL